MTTPKRPGRRSRAPGGARGGKRTGRAGRGADGGSRVGAGPGRDRGVGGDQVEGRRAVRELLAAGRRRVREVWLAEGVEDTPVLAEIAELAARLRVPVRSVSRGRLEAEARTDAPQGVLAYAEPLADVELDHLLRPGPNGPPPFLVCLDGVTDPHNLGAILRSAAAAGATGAVLPRHRSAHVTPTVAKAAAGAIEHVPIAVVPGIAGALVSCQAAGVWTVGLDASGPARVFDLDLASEPIALVLGAEGSGLSRLVRQRCDVVAAIPLAGGVESLNVAAAAAIACFEVKRRRS